MTHQSPSQIRARDWHILLVDNDSEDVTVRTWPASLRDAGYRHVEVAVGAEAVQLARKRFKRGEIDLLVTDIRLKDNDDERDRSGLVLAEELSKLIPVIVVTAHSTAQYARDALEPHTALAYVEKNNGVGALIQAVEQAPRRYREHVSGNPPYQDRIFRRMTLTCVFGQPIGIHCDDVATRTDECLFGEDGWLASTTAIPGASWHAECKRSGVELFRRVFGHREVAECYRKLQGAEGDRPENVHLRFDGPIACLKIPVEYCCEPNSVRDNFVVAKHPLARSVLNLEPARSAISPEFLNELKAQNRPLRILLIASDTLPDIPAVDTEVTKVGQLLRREFANQGLRVVVDVLGTNRAALETVEEAVRTGRYDIVHYAGHSGFDKTRPDRSGVVLWRRPNRQGGRVFVQVSQLNAWLSDSSVRFVYLSSCESAQSGVPSQLWDNDFLGISSGVLSAGVPAVLGLRWPLYDRSGMKLALAFYQELTKTGQLDLALWRARRTIRELANYDSTWMSPVLIVQ